MKTLVHVSSDQSYYHFEKVVRDVVSAKHDRPIFTTNAEGLFEAYLSGIQNDRQHYNCKNCQRFLENYGGLATVRDDGSLEPLFWGKGDWPAFFVLSAENMRDLVCRAKITGVFLNDQDVWGNPKTGDWTHLSGVPNFKFKHVKLTASQMMADKKQDFGILRHGLADFNIEVARQAVRILEADALDRSEKTLGVAQWFLKLHEAIKDLKGPRRDNLIWMAVATAPPGWCHVRSSMISTLLDDLAAGKDFNAISAAWNKKMHPLQYQRPTAPVSDGQIAAANKLMTKLGAEGALGRRFAKLEEVTCFWKPTPMEEAPKPPSGGVFDSLKSKPNPCAEIVLPAKTLTWVRFRDEVLPKAKKMEFEAKGYGAYYGMVTAINPDAPNLMQWDNPVSWFFFHGGSMASKWNLVAGSWVEIKGMCYKPPHWKNPEQFTHHEWAVHLILDGCRLTRSQPGGLFFPENMKAEYREIRSVLETYSNRNEVAGHEEGTANGFALQKGDTFNAKVRVNGSDLYLLDRWD